jgi:hypothetical protein
MYWQWIAFFEIAFGDLAEAVCPAIELCRRNALDTPCEYRVVPRNLQERREWGNLQLSIRQTSRK